MNRLITNEVSQERKPASFWRAIVADWRVKAERMRQESHTLEAQAYQLEKCAKEIEMKIRKEP